jgi:uncharacterized protein YeeX (DUF496 family)
MFHVIALETQSPIRGADGAPIVFANGRDAAAFAQEHTRQTGKKHQPRPIKSDNWRQREQQRFTSGVYIRLPWCEESWWRGSIGEFEHFAHVSTDKPGMVAFTEDANKGAADRQTRVKPGVYLTRYFETVLSREDIQRRAREFAGQYEDNVLQFATTADEIEQVYVNGPRSCMAGAASDYDSPIHPVRVYAAGDLAIAYLTADGDITARALCWPAKKVYGRIYGDEYRLGAALTAAEYKQQSSALYGAKLTRHEYDDNLVCPYIDGAMSVEDDGDVLRIGGDISADSTNGLIRLEPQGEYCPSCDTGGHDDGSMYFIRDREEYWCEDCADNNAYRAQDGGFYGHRDNVVEMANGEYWTTRHFENNGGTCSATDENHPIDNLIYVEDVGDYWCLEHFERHGFTCEECGESFSNDAKGARRDHCEQCTGAAPPRDSNSRFAPHHRPRAGRDENPNQLELPTT